MPPFSSFQRAISLGQPREFVRAAAHLLYFQYAKGALILRADVAYDVLPAVNDPLVKSSFLSAYAMALALSARYEDGSRRLAPTCSTSRGDGIGLISRFRTRSCAVGAGAVRACGRWRRAEEMLIARSDAMSLDPRRSRRTACCFAPASPLSSQGSRRQKRSATRAPAACAEHLRPPSAKYMCSRALVLACIGSYRRSSSELDTSPRATAPLSRWSWQRSFDAVCALRDRARQMLSNEVSELESDCFRDGSGRSSRHCLSSLSRASVDSSSFWLRPTFRELGRAGRGRGPGHEPSGSRCRADEDKRRHFCRLASGRSTTYWFKGSRTARSASSSSSKSQPSRHTRITSTTSSGPFAQSADRSGGAGEVPITRRLRRSRRTPESGSSSVL